MTVNRVVTFFTALLGVGAAVTPVLADTDWQSTAGILVGAGLACAAALKWLDGWQKHEARQDSLAAWPQTVDATADPAAADPSQEHDPELDEDPEFGALLAGVPPIADDEDPPDDKDAPTPPAVDEVLPVTTHAHLKD